MLREECICGEKSGTMTCRLFIETYCVSCCSTQDEARPHAFFQKWRNLSLATHLEWMHMLRLSNKRNTFHRPVLPHFTFCMTWPWLKKILSSTRRAGYKYIQGLPSSNHKTSFKPNVALVAFCSIPFLSLHCILGFRAKISTLRNLGLSGSFSLSAGLPQPTATYFHTERISLPQYSRNLLPR